LIRVLIVDDSRMIRDVLTDILKEQPDIQVVGAAADAFEARDLIKSLNPDVITLDVEMPKMNGLEFLDRLMRAKPIPVVMISSATERGSEVTFRALELGAVDFVTKPKLNEQTPDEFGDQIAEKIRAAKSARLKAPRRADPNDTASMPAAAPVVKRPVPRGVKTSERIIAVGASTGGTEAIREVLEQMPPDAPAVVITQHIPPAFSRPFAERMNRSSAMAVCEAADGQLIVPGHAYIAPGGRHLTVVRDGARYVCRINDAPPENRHRPSVDVLFRSVAQNAGHNAVGALLTGMGDDGARGLLTLRQAGAHTLAQDEASSVVWGMPGSAVKLQAPEQVLPLERIAGQLLAWTA